MKSLLLKYAEQLARADAFDTEIFGKRARGLLEGAVHDGVHRRAVLLRAVVIDA